MEVDKYLADHGIRDLFQRMMQDVVQRMPNEPLDFLIAALQGYKLRGTKKNDDEDDVSDIFETQSVASVARASKLAAPHARPAASSSAVKRASSTAAPPVDPRHVARPPSRGGSEVGSTLSRPSPRPPSTEHKERPQLFKPVEPSTVADDDEEDDIESSIPPEVLAKMNAQPVKTAAPKPVAPTVAPVVAPPPPVSDDDMESDDDCLELAEDLSELDHEYGGSKHPRRQSKTVARPHRAAVCSKCQTKIEPDASQAFATALVSKEPILHRVPPTPSGEYFAKTTTDAAVVSSDDDIMAPDSPEPKKRGKPRA